MPGLNYLFAKENAPIEKILVAFSMSSMGMVMAMACDGEANEEEIDHLSEFIEELAAFGKEPNQGLWVWEGKMWGVQDNTPDSLDWDTKTEGEWREPTAEEWEKIQEQEDPWPKGIELPGSGP